MGRSHCRCLVWCWLVLCWTPAVEARDELSAADWQGIRAAHEAQRLAIQEVPGGYEAANPGQHWLTRFDGRGFSTQGAEGTWTWGLQLESYGHRAHACIRTMHVPLRVSTDGARVVYHWDDSLQEWFVNQARGLEHGYTLLAPPCAGEAEHGSGVSEPADRTRGPLRLVLALRGDLRAELAPGGRDVHFVDAAGCLRLRYTGLLVQDADGRRLAAHFELAPDGLLLEIDDTDARYPLEVDPVAQEAYLKASNSEAGDHFGWSVAASGDTVIVGAPGEDSSAVTINGSQSNNGAPDSGAAYVFVRTATGWAQKAYLKASNAEAGDSFGISVAIDGDLAVVGANEEDSAATGVNGSQVGNTLQNAGAAYVFTGSGGNWLQQAYLKASNTGALDGFGSAVAISGLTVAVGAYGEASPTAGVNGQQGLDTAPSAGAAYVFVRTAGVWAQQAYLKASNTGGGDSFGFSLALSGDTLAVGAFLEDSSATGIGGQQQDDSASAAGAAYVFTRSGTSWSQQAYLKASNAQATDWFGAAVALSGDTLVVGAPSEESSATGVDGDQANNGAIDSGAAYVFARSGAIWSQQAYLKASNTSVASAFGHAVDVSGDTILVGAWGESGASVGVNAGQNSNGSPSSGSAYLFVLDGEQWGHHSYLKASNTGSPDSFGTAVALGDDYAVVGAFRESSNATGIGGSQSNNSATFAGAAYAFELDLDRGPWTDLGGGSAGLQAVPRLALVGPLTPLSSLAVTLEQAAPHSLLLGLWSFSSTPLPVLGGTLHVNPPAMHVLWTSDASGGFHDSWTWPVGVAPGTPFFAQVLVQDPSVLPGGIALSNAVTRSAP